MKYMRRDRMTDTWGAMTMILVGWIALAANTPAHAAPPDRCAWEWDADFGVPGIGHDGHEAGTMLVADLGDGPALYLAGIFTSVGGVPARSIARWDGTTWSAFDHGLSESLMTSVRCLALYDDGSGSTLYAGGTIRMSDGITANVVRWNGDAWESTGYVGSAMAMLVSDNGSGSVLYVGGGVPSAATDGGGLAAVQKWDGSSWTLVGGVFGATSASVWALAIHDDGAGPALYAGGSVWAPNVAAARWDGTEWLPLHGISEGRIRSLASYDSGDGAVLYAGGEFWQSSQPMWGMAWLDGESWKHPPLRPDGRVNALLIHDEGGGPALYAAGWFPWISRQPAPALARWNGRHWTPLIDEGNQQISALAVFDDGSGPALYVSRTSDGINSQVARRRLVLPSIDIEDISELALDPAQRTLIAERTPKPFAAIARLKDGSAIDVSCLVQWTSDDPEVATVSAGGVVTGRSPEATTTITAEVGGFSAACTVTVISLAACEKSDEDCFEPHGHAGCGSESCCERICAIDPRCCTEWDEACTALASELCPALYYQFDDGSAEQIIRSPPIESSGGTVMYMNQFEVEPGAEAITEIRVTWPNTLPSAPWIEGIRSTLYIWSDPDQDGDPSDAEVLLAHPHPVGPANAIETVRISPVVIGPPGTKFFVGYGIDTLGTGYNAFTNIARPRAAFDVDSEQGNGWVAVFFYWSGGFGDPNEIGSADYLALIHEACDTCGGNFMIRAGGVPAGPFPILGDLNGDGLVNTLDLLILISAWGPCPDHGACPADLNGSAAVDVQDLLILLANWG